MLLRLTLAVLIFAISFSATAQDNSFSSSGGSTKVSGLSDLERKMRVYLNLNAMEDVSMEDLASRCQSKMWRQEQLGIEDTEFLLESGFLEYLFTEVQNETDMEKKGKKIYQIQTLLDQNIVLNSEYAEKLLDHQNRAKYVSSAYNSEQDRVVPYTLRRELASYHNLPNTTTLNDLIEKTVAGIVENGIKMRYEDIDLLLNKKLYKYMCTEKKWEADVLLVGFMLLYNTDEFGLTMSSTNFNMIRDVLSMNELLVSQGMNVMMAQNGKGIPTSEVIKEVRQMMTQKCLIKAK